MPRALLVVFSLMGAGLILLGLVLWRTQNNQSIAILGVAVAVSGAIVEALSLIYQVRYSRTPHDYHGEVNFSEFQRWVESNRQPGLASVIFKVPSWLVGKDLNIRPLRESRKLTPAHIQRYNAAYENNPYDVIVALFENIEPRNDCDYEIVTLRGERVGKVTVAVDSPQVHMREVSEGEVRGKNFE